MPIVLTEESPLAAELLADEEDFEITEERAAFIARALEEADIEAASPDAEWVPAAEVIQMMREKYCGL
jgi:hypothetical protein